MSQIIHHNVTPQVQHWVRVCDLQTRRLVWSDISNHYVGDAAKISKLSRYDALRRSI